MVDDDDEEEEEDDVDAGTCKLCKHKPAEATSER